MKKIMAVLLTAAVTFWMVNVAMAVECDVKTTVSNITGATASTCEDAGSMSFTFKTGTKIQSGDYWTGTLTAGTLCKTINFVIGVMDPDTSTGGDGVPGINANIGNSLAITADAVAAPAKFAGATTLAWDVANGSAEEVGPFKLTDLGQDGNGSAGTLYIYDCATATASYLSSGGSSMYFHVYGASGSQQITIKALDDEGTASTTATIQDATFSDGSTALEVGEDTEFTIKLFDAEKHVGGGTAVNDSYAFTDDGEITTTTTNEASNWVYGDAGTADLLNAQDYYNTLCVNAYNAGVSQITMTLDSWGHMATKYITFDPMVPTVAYIISSTSLSFQTCKSTTDNGYINASGGQSGSCEFYYDRTDLGTLSAANGYCTGFKGNVAVLKRASGTWEGNSQYRVVMSATNAYFGDDPDVIAAYTTAAAWSDQTCSTGGTDLDGGTAWTATTESGTTFTAYPTGTTCATTLTTSTAVNKLTSPAFTLNLYHAIRVDVPKMVYTTTQASAGTKSVLTVQLYKLPCGIVFEGTKLLGEYVTSCGSTYTTTIVYPYSTQLNGADGWWFGFSFANNSANAGSYTIYVYEDDGDQFSITSTALAGAISGIDATLAAHDMVTLAGSNLVSVASSFTTVASTGGGTMGDARSHIVVSGSFDNGVGFGMMGNGSDSTGYPAYTTDDDYNN